MDVNMVNGKLVVENMSEDELNQAWDIMGHSLMQSFFRSPHPTSLRKDDKDKDKKKLQGRLGNKEAISAVGKRGNLFGFHGRRDGGRTMVESPKATLGFNLYPELWGWKLWFSKTSGHKS